MFAYATGYGKLRDLTVAADLRSVGVSLGETPRLLRGTDSEMFLSPHNSVFSTDERRALKARKGGCQFCEPSG